MNFNDMKYVRPNYDEVSAKYNNLLDQLDQSTNSKDFLKLFYEINEIKIEIETMQTLSSIRHSIDTSDKFYNEENDYWDEISPKYQVLSSRLSSITINKPFREDLMKDIPETFFKLAEFQLKSFDKKIVEDLIEENKLSSEYDKIKASAQIEFDGEILNLAQFGPKFESHDRNIRKKAYNKYTEFYKKHDKEIGDIYDKLVKVRDRIAKKLGYENFIELGYYRMNRFDYNEKMVEGYRKQILEEITPLATKIYNKQAKRLGLDKLEYYDFKYAFITGNATPKGSYDELIKSCKTMYHEMSEETKEFIDVLINNDLWDLKSKPNKALGGYCTSILKYKVPFIFANFNGTSGDVDVLTHEAGHAFQAYMSKDIKVPECVWPTYESCEIHSMSMEFFAHPWMKGFFKEDTEKYYFSHLSGALTFLPYGVLVDHFQHEVYKNPNWTNEERKECFRKLEKQYLPFKNYEGCDFYEEGGFWYQQGHIFGSPFYYIDYTLAQVCALQFLKKIKEDYQAAWNDYLHLCKLGGTKTFLNLVKEANLISPFEEGCIKSVVSTIDEYLDNIDDTKL